MGGWEGEWRAAGVCGPYIGECGKLRSNFSAAFQGTHEGGVVGIL